MNKKLIFKKIVNNYLEKESITIVNNKVILTINRLVLEQMLTHICFPFRKMERR